MFCIVCNCYANSVTLPETICNLNISFLFAGFLQCGPLKHHLQFAIESHPVEPPAWQKLLRTSSSLLYNEKISISSLDLVTQPNKKVSMLPMSNFKSGSVFNRSTTSCTKNRSHEKILESEWFTCLYLFQNFKQQMRKKFSESQKSKKEKQNKKNDDLTFKQLCVFVDTTSGCITQDKSPPRHLKLTFLHLHSSLTSSLQTRIFFHLGWHLFFGARAFNGMLTLYHIISTA